MLPGCSDAWGEKKEGKKKTKQQNHSQQDPFGKNLIQQGTSSGSLTVDKATSTA